MLHDMLQPIQQPSGIFWVKCLFQTDESILNASGWLPYLIIHYRKQVMVIHYLHKVSCPDLPHLALLVVKFPHFPVEPPASLHNCLKVNNIIEIAFHSRYFAYQGFNLFITENCSDTASSCLLQASPFSALDRKS
ncbi:MAG: hypothetical protein MZV64_35700 [Ignavibacteriales bacterium]|nr:hypothetical protein [Ignavibacteriales bacterium]